MLELSQNKKVILTSPSSFLILVLIVSNLYFRIGNYIRGFGISTICKNGDIKITTHHSLDFFDDIADGESVDRTGDDDRSHG